MIEIYSTDGKTVTKTVIAPPPPPEDRVRPFSCGSECGFWDWDEYNCSECAHGDRYADGDPPDGGREYEWGRCLLRDAISEAYIGDGTISKEVAEKTATPPAGPCRKEFAAEWRCPSRVLQKTAEQIAADEAQAIVAAERAATLPLFDE